MDSLDAAGVAEGIFWFILLYVITVIPLWLGSMVVLGIIYLIARASRKSPKNPDNISS